MRPHNATTSKQELASRPTSLKFMAGKQSQQKRGGRAGSAIPAGAGGSGDAARIRPSLATQPFTWSGLQVLPIAASLAGSVAVVPPPLPVLFHTAPFRWVLTLLPHTHTTASAQLFCSVQSVLYLGVSPNAALFIFAWRLVIVKRVAGTPCYGVHVHTPYPRHPTLRIYLLAARFKACSSPTQPMSSIHSEGLYTV